MFIMPLIRKLILQLLSGIKSRYRKSQKDSTIKLIGEIIKACSDYVHPYCQPIYELMVEELVDENRSVTITAILNVIENVLIIGFVDITDTYEGLFEKLINYLRQQISVSTSVASLKVMKQIIIIKQYN